MTCEDLRMRMGSSSSSPSAAAPNIEELCVRLLLRRRRSTLKISESAAAVARCTIEDRLVLSYHARGFEIEDLLVVVVLGGGGASQD
jgi:hypothetical protein